MAYHTFREVDAAYRRGVQDGRKQAADEVFAAIHAEEMRDGYSFNAYGLRDEALSDLRRRLAHLFLTEHPGPPHEAPAPPSSREPSRP